MKKHVLLFNPNTSASVTEDMIALALLDHASWARVDGQTAGTGASIILSAADLHRAEACVADLGQTMSAMQWPFDAIVIGAFGDPGVEDLRKASPLPVVGIGEAALMEASARGGPYSIVTTTPDLEPSIRSKAMATGTGTLASIRLTTGSPAEVMSDPVRLDDALGDLILTTIEQDCPSAIVVAGGPLAASARRIGPRFSIPIIDPVTAAFRRLHTLLGATSNDWHPTSTAI